MLPTALLLPSGLPLHLALPGPLKDTFSSDSHENFYDGPVKDCDPDVDRLLKICVQNGFRKKTASEAEAELNYRGTSRFVGLSHGVLTAKSSEV
ncbi:hypothetical protein EAE96_003601 [Botrytis aclada]|nr:hypothetical protein EAE96_003601 [Botrytis aclada]